MSFTDRDRERWCGAANKGAFLCVRFQLGLAQIKSPGRMIQKDYLFRRL